MWHAENAIDRYALCHLTSAAGDSLARDLARRLGLLLPAGGRGEVAGRRLPRPHDAPARRRGPAPGDPARPGRAATADLVPRRRRPRGHRVLRRGRASTPSRSSRRRSAILVAARVHGITKNGLTMAYARPGRGADAVERPARASRGGGGAHGGAVRRRRRRPLGLGRRDGLAGIVYSVCALRHAPAAASAGASTAPKPIGRRGRIPSSPGRRSARRGCAPPPGSSCSCRRSRSGARASPPRGSPRWRSRRPAGGFLADVLAPRLPGDPPRGVRRRRLHGRGRPRRVPRVHGVLPAGPRDLRARRRARPRSSAGSRSRA